MTEQSHSPSALLPEERVSVEEIEHVKIIGYQEFPVPVDAVVAGEPWKAIGAGLNSEGGQLVVVENPVTHDRIVIRGDHLRSTEQYTPDPTVEGIGAEAVEQVVDAPHESNVSSVRIIRDAQSER